MSKLLVVLLVLIFAPAACAAAAVSHKQGFVKAKVSHLKLK